MYSLWEYLFIPTLVQIGFCTIFFINKCSETRDNYKWRNMVFLYYLFGNICFNYIYLCAMVFFAGLDTEMCGNLEIPWCPGLYRAATMVEYGFTLIIQLYFAFNLKTWADNRKADKKYTIL